jgi:ligand-binding sensor domain-containing protein
MSERLYVGTRKGLFLYERGPGGKWRIERTAFLGDPVSYVFPDGRDGTIYAALNLGHFGTKLHRSFDSGETFHEIQAPAYPKAEEEEKEGAPSVKQIWCLEAGGADRAGVLWAGTIPGGLFRSDDRGESWRLNEPLWNVPERARWFGGGYDHPGIHSVIVDPNDSKRLVVGVSCGGVWITEDDGGSWQASTKGMFAEYMPPENRDDPAIQDPHRMVICPGAPNVLWVQHHNGVFRSSDGGRSWQSLTSKPSSFGFAAAIHPRDPKTSWLAPLVKDERRVPVDGKVVVARTRDGGESFEVLREGLPQEHAYDVVYRHGMDVDHSGDRLALGSTTGSLWLSEDQGDSFRTLSTQLPPIYSLRFA